MKHHLNLPASTPDKQAMLRPALASLYLGISRTCLHRLSETDSSFPRKIVISSRCVGYLTASLDAWLAAKESV
jgi:predicted DNA-binding transcriptional regulator AlpA